MTVLIVSVAWCRAFRHMGPGGKAHCAPLSSSQFGFTALSLIPSLRSVLCSLVDSCVTHLVRIQLSFIAFSLMGCLGRDCEPSFNIK